MNVFEPHADTRNQMKAYHSNGENEHGSGWGNKTGYFNSHSQLKKKSKLFSV